MFYTHLFQFVGDMLVKGQIHQRIPAGIRREYPLGRVAENGVDSPRIRLWIPAGIFAVLNTLPASGIFA